MTENETTKLTSEQIQKAKAAASAEELLELAHGASIELSEEAAQQAFARLHPAEEKISIDDLDDVAGGCDDDEGRGYDVVDAVCPRCGTWGPEYEGHNFQGATCCYCHNCGYRWSVF